MKIISYISISNDISDMSTSIYLNWYKQYLIIYAVIKIIKITFKIGIRR